MHYLILHSENKLNSALHDIFCSNAFPHHELISALTKAHSFLDEKKTVFVIDADCEVNNLSSDIKTFSEDTPLKLKTNSSINDKITLSDARYITEFDNSLLERVLETTNADIIAIDIDPELSGFREKFTFDSDGNIAGIRRVFSDTIVSSSIPQYWPHHIYIHKASLEKYPEISSLPGDFTSFISLCVRYSLTVKTVRIAGKVHDLHDSTTFLKFVDKCLSFRLISNPSPSQIGKSTKYFGNIYHGENVTIGDNCILAGPCIIGNNIEIPDNSIIRNSIVLESPGKDTVRIENSLRSDNFNTDSLNEQYDIKFKKALYRDFSSWTYPKCWKRLADIIFAAAFLLASLPVFIAVAIAIKISSPGPIFFRHKRQGLHGKEFGCTKFRTMIVGADDIQDQLRKINEVDGPQFKMDDDPRVNTIGKFLRDTGIDEFPQFINVLMGQMSVVGPRPSPEKENAFCAYWRDARLSVRPGITGLWQVKRTREEGKDFQEWVIHDTNYVKNVSLWLDIKICFMTVKYLVKSFIEQF